MTSFAPARPPAAPSAFARVARAWTGVALMATLVACGGETPREITQVVERDDAPPPAPQTTPAMRFRHALEGDADPHARLRIPSGAPSSDEAPATRPEAGIDAPDATPSPFTWEAPVQWKRQGARAMRLATYVPEGARGTEIAVSRLSGKAGGTRLNLDRWRQQVGLPALSDAEFDALPRASVLGGTATFLFVDGTDAGKTKTAAEGSPDSSAAPTTGSSGTAGMSTSEGAAGHVATPNARLAGMAVEREKDMVFVKMTGPSDEVRAEEARFRAFCESLRE